MKNSNFVFQLECPMRLFLLLWTFTLEFPASDLQTLYFYVNKWLQFGSYQILSIFIAILVSLSALSNGIICNFCSRKVSFAFCCCNFIVLLYHKSSSSGSSSALHQMPLKSKKENVGSKSLSQASKEGRQTNKKVFVLPSKLMTISRISLLDFKRWQLNGYL